MGYVRSSNALVLIGAVLMLGQTSNAFAADKVRISGLQTANFGQLAGTGDRSISQNLCAYSSSVTGGYSVTATGTGSGGAFSLTSSIATISYEVLWADTSGQNSGTSLIAGTPIGGFTSNATQHFCNSGPTSSASMTIVIRSATIQSARAGTYSGTLQIMIVPE